jgi:hypothetical protein
MKIENDLKDDRIKDKTIEFFEWELINIEEDIGDLILYYLNKDNLKIVIFKKNIKNGN